MPEKPTILVAEDNDFVRMQIARYLSETGAQVIEASNGDQALDFIVGKGAAHITPNLAIIDIRMEPGDGFDFIKRVRALDIDMPFILVTGDNNPDILERAGALGVNAVMIKPVQKDRLVKTVLRTIEGHKRREMEH